MRWVSRYSGCRCRILKSRGEFQTAGLGLACVSCAVTAAKYHSVAASDTASAHVRCRYMRPRRVGTSRGANGRNPGWLLVSYGA